MTATVSELEVELRTAIQRSLHHALSEVLALPQGRRINQCTRSELGEAVARCRSAIDAVRLFASEYAELEGLTEFSPSSLRGAEHATGICDQLEEEVNVVHDELVIYVS